MNKVSAFVALLCLLSFGIAYSQSRESSTICTDNLFDQEKSSISDVEYSVSNRGVFGFDFMNLSPGIFWPRDSDKSYCYGAGFWFGALKETEDGNFRKMVELTYDPYNGQSWFVPGRYEDGPEADQNLNSSYQVYSSEDYRSDGSRIEGDYPDWPIWFVEPPTRSVLFNDLEKAEFVNDLNERNIENYPAGPAFLADEMFFSTYKDGDLGYFEGGSTMRKKRGYPLGLQVEEFAMSWGSGKGYLKDAVVLNYRIERVGEDTLYDCYFAPLYDVDIRFGDNLQQVMNDNGLFYYPDEELSLGYAWSGTDKGESGKGFGYFACMALRTPSVDEEGFLINEDDIPSEDHIGLSSFRTWAVEDNYSDDNARYDFIASGIKDANPKATDLRLMLSIGPFNFKPEEVIDVSIGLFFSPPAVYEDADGSGEDIVGMVDRAKKIKNFFYGEVNDVDENYQAERVSIYPNPSSGEFSIDLGVFSEIDRIAIYNSIGEVVFESNAMGDRIINVSIDSPPGLYLVKIEAGEMIILKKLIIR